MERSRLGWIAASAYGVALLAMASCATDGNAPLPNPTPISCPPLKAYTPAQQQALATALKALPADSPLVQAMVDYGQLRSATRACAGLP